MSRIVCQGLSPHGRGIQFARYPRQWQCGPIPAWAGDTEKKKGLRPLGWAYPRMGGGYGPTPLARIGPLGLSPHGRGIRTGLIRNLEFDGPIPAWAGDTTTGPEAVCLTRAYPRMGGGYADNGESSMHKKGLSPHGRGILSIVVGQAVVPGPIPAWAGDTPQKPRLQAATRAYPRMGGGYDAEDFKKEAGAGLSPHGRGIRRPWLRRPASPGPIPAWAGDTRRMRTTRCRSRAYPRMGGGYRNGKLRGQRRRGLSPHGRGIRFKCPAVAL